MQIDITSDLHLDFWVDVRHPASKQKRLIKSFVNALLPENPSPTLLIAGDIGHHNWQNELMFSEFKKTYDKILWVHGNHDLYMISKKMVESFNRNSFLRLADMVDRTNQIAGVHYLNGDVIEIDGYKIGGCGMWYDGTYASDKHFLSDNHIQSMWLDTMNDANLIYVPDNVNERINWLQYSQEQKEKLELIFRDCDIIVSHVAPTYEHFSAYRQVPESTFYQFDGSRFLEHMDRKWWLFGHTHDLHYFTHSNGCTMMCNPLGYPFGESSFNGDIMKRRKFRTIDIGSSPISYEELFGSVTNGDEHEQE